MMARRNISSILLLGLLLWAVSAVAVDDGGGRSVFATGAGNRALGMGGAFSAVADDASAPIYNPAGLGRVESKGFQATQTTLFGLGFNEQYASFVLPHWKFGTASLTWRRFAVDGIEQRDDRGFLLDGDLEDSETELSLGYGHAFLDGDLSLGGSLKFQRQSLAGYDGSGVGLDLGIWARPLTLAGVHSDLAHSLAAGFSVRNVIEPSIKLVQDNVPDPTAWRAGLAWDSRLSDGIALIAAVDVEKTRDMDSRLHAGLEGRILDALALRIGTSDDKLTAGLGLNWRGLGVDYQYEDNHLGDIHRFGLDLRFGPTVEQSRQAAHDANEAAVAQRLEAAFAVRTAQEEAKLALDINQALDSHQWETALALVSTMSVIQPEHENLSHWNTTCWRGIARDQEEAEDLTAAAISWRRVLAIKANDSQAQAGLARIQAENDRRAEYSREYKTRFNLALDAFARDDLRAARDGFKTVLLIAPNDPDALVMLERTESALIHQNAAQQRLEMEIETANQARLPKASSRPLDDPPTSAAAVVLDEPAPAPASPSKDQLREINEYYRRGVVAMDHGRPGEAVRFWELVWAVDPDHEQVRQFLNREYLARGMEAYAGGSLNQAVASWEDALRVDPNDMRAQGYLERAQQQLSRLENINGSR